MKQPGDLALVLTGGGARAAYQVGFLRCLARNMPGLRIPIITGVSAGAINAAHLAAYKGPFDESVEGLSDLWFNLDVSKVFHVDSWSLAKSSLRWLLRLGGGGNPLTPRTKGIVDTAPLSRLLRRALVCPTGEIPGIADNLDSGALRAVALVTVNYSTGQTVTWVQGCDIQTWSRPNRIGRNTRLTVEHVMASSALPFFFPAVQLGDDWFGDGGIRFAAPLSPALHLGARRIIAISTRYRQSPEEASRSTINGYPPPAQILGNLLNAIFLDALDEDVLRATRFNELLRALPEDERQGMEPVDMLVLRPSEDLGALAAQYEIQLPKAFRFLTRGLGTRETKSPDFLSLLMFQPDYLRKLIAIGERDAETSLDAMMTLLG